MENHELSVNGPGIFCERMEGLSVKNQGISKTSKTADPINICKKGGRHVLIMVHNENVRPEHMCVHLF